MFEDDPTPTDPIQAFDDGNREVTARSPNPLLIDSSELPVMEPAPLLIEDEPNISSKRSAPTPQPRKLTLPLPGDVSKSKSKPTTGEPAQPRTPSFAPKPRQPSSPRAQALDPAVFDKLKREKIKTGRTMVIISVLLVGVIGGLFIWGATRDRYVPITELEEGRPASSLALPARPRSIKDRYRLEHPDLIVRSPRTVPSPELERPKRVLGKPPVIDRRKGNGHSMWSRARLEKIAGEKNPKYGMEDVPPPKNMPKYEDEPDPPAVSMLMVMSRPPGVVVERDGKIVGVTPLVRVVDGTASSINVKLRSPGYKNKSASISKNKNGQYQLGVTMELLPER